MKLPQTLYHGSMYLDHELQPGYLRSGEETFWDQNESNHYLYATTDKQLAIGLGLGSAIEKQHVLDQYKIDKDTITIIIPKDTNLTLKDLYQLKIYLYTIIPQNKDKWLLNNNKHNRLKTEWKT